MPTLPWDNHLRGSATGEPNELEHGGRLRAAAQDYGIPLAQWLDLSTGINPKGWPVPAVPQWVWSRLPEDNDGLEDAARAYYGTDSLLPVAGSQTAIQLLPRLWPSCRVHVIEPGYAEHAAAWRIAGHTVKSIAAAEIENCLPDTDVLVLINPNNPTGERWSAAQLLEWHDMLAEKDGCLIVDEAFADTQPDGSVARHSHRPGLIVLRSLGKFFGLAGARAGFVCAHPSILKRLKNLLGPWQLSNPARWVANAALGDNTWQTETRQRLGQDSGRLINLLQHHGLPPSGGCELFQWVPSSQAAAIHEVLGKQGILTRVFDEPSALRFGLPGGEADWQRLEAALQNLEPDLTSMAS